MKQIVAILLIVLLAACNSTTTSEKTMSAEMATKNKLSQVTVTKMLGNQSEKIFTKQMEMQSIVQIVAYAKPYNENVVLHEPQYKVEAKYVEGVEQNYDIWLQPKEQKGWVRKEGDEDKLFVLNKEEIEKVTELFSFTQSAGEKKQSAQLTQHYSVDIKNFQINTFTIQEGLQEIDYDITYKLSDSLYQALTTQNKYYFQIVCPPKVQGLLGIKESGAVQGEMVKNGNKEYKVQIRVPISNLTESQRKAIAMSYEGYNLVFLDDIQQPKATFSNIIQMVKQNVSKLD